MSYTVKKGEHYSAPALVQALRAVPGLTLTGRRAAYFTLDETFEPDPSGDIAKVFGLSDDLDHHCCSARFGLGLPQAGGRCGLYAYTYLDGVRSHAHIMDLHLRGTYLLELLRLEESWVYSAQSMVTSEWRPEAAVAEAEPGRPLFQYTLFPYYGGDAPAPRDTNFNLEWT